MTPPKMTLPMEPTYQDYATLNRDQANTQKLIQQAYEQEIARYQSYMEERETKSIQASSLIRLLLKDGPLLQTRRISNALEL